MSVLHSESNDNVLSLTVRVKLVNLNYTSKAPSASPRRPAAERVTRECLGAIAGSSLGGTMARPYSPDTALPATESASNSDRPNVEICMLTRERIPVSDFETHIESCKICANRVDLQLDFMEALEVAVYQRKVKPESQKLRGAMLVSAPKLNFAICGELEIG